MPQFYPLRVSQVRRETDDAVSVLFIVPTELQSLFNYAQGQHLTLRRDFAGTEERRNYSICSSVQDEQLRIAVKKLPDGVFSSYINEQLKAGETIDVMPPSGRFYTQLSPDQAKHYVAFAIGSGITPIFSIIKTTLETEPKSQFCLIYGNRNTRSIIFLEQLEALKNQYPTRLQLLHILSQEAQDLELLNGRIDKAKVTALLTTLLPVERIDECFICGPQAMVETTRQVLQQHGLTVNKIHFELFNTITGQQSSKAAKLSREEAEHLSQITIILAGKKSKLALRRADESILDAALRIRADMPFACKGGMCCTCRAKVVAGKVEMDSCYGLEKDEIEQGYILTCQAHPVSDQVVIDYDQR